jgi:hypothetical protein
VAGYPPLRPKFDSGLNNVGSAVERAALGQVFSEYYGFLCQSFIPLIVPQLSTSIILGWYNTPKWQQ